MESNLKEDGSIRDTFGNYIAVSRYARWIEEEGRRETWSESVDRYIGHMTGHLKKRFGYIPDASTVEEIRKGIYDLDLVPSMRAMTTAGPALERSNIAGYNCSYLPIQDIFAFSELLYILMNGAGVGYSVERKYVDQLPSVPEDRGTNTDVLIVVGDSKEGWAEAFDELLRSLWSGQKVYWDLSLVRPKGARLKTFGGHASGPEPLDELFRFTVETFRQARGRKLRPIEVHDIICKVAKVIVSGGVRRSAMIALTDLDDEEMAAAKSGAWWEKNNQRALANISAVYYDGTSREEFDKEWANLVASGSGERGIFNRDAARRQASKNGKRVYDEEYGTNPCSEIILKPFSFCNLSEVIVKPEDCIETLSRKVALASILGTWQSTLTDFPYLREEWSRNAEEERLLGVSLTGIFGNTLLNSTDSNTKLVLETLNFIAEASNRDEAEALGISASDAITCVKPSGTVSQLAGVSSGLHPWHSEYYIRTIREAKDNALSELMYDYEIPCEEDVTNDRNYVFSFPVKAPEGAKVRSDLTAIDHLEIWLMFHEDYCDHKPSVTISVRDDEWDKVGEWVWNHLDKLSGVSFFPHDDHTYQQAPYRECTAEEYEKAVAEFPDVRWADLVFYEQEDQTESSHELACSAGGCDLK